MRKVLIVCAAPMLLHLCSYLLFFGYCLWFNGGHFYDPGNEYWQFNPVSSKWYEYWLNFELIMVFLMLFWTFFSGIVAFIFLVAHREWRGFTILAGLIIITCLIFISKFGIVLFPD